jgi:hypothetical protein
MLKERSELKLIDEEVRMSMTRYFEESAVFYNKMSAWQREFVIGNIEPYVLKHLPIDSLGRTDPTAVTTAMTDPELKNYVNMQLRNFKEMNKYTARALSEAKNLLELIEDELNEDP